MKMVPNKNLSPFVCPANCDRFAVVSLIVESEFKTQPVQNDSTGDWTLSKPEQTRASKSKRSGACEQFSRPLEIPFTALQEAVSRL